MPSLLPYYTIELRIVFGGATSDKLSKSLLCLKELSWAAATELAEQLAGISFLIKQNAEILSSAAPSKKALVGELTVRFVPSLHHSFL